MATRPRTSQRPRRRIGARLLFAAAAVEVGRSASAETASVVDYAAFASALGDSAIDRIEVTEHITGCVGWLVGWLVC